VTSTSAEELAETLVELADTSVGEFDLDGFLLLLANRCVRHLDVAAADLLLTDHGRTASDERAAALSEDGPGLECCRAGAPVAVPDLARAVTRWPRFTAEARGAGYASAHAVPLRRRTEVIGAMTLLRTETGEMRKSDVRLAQALADVATVGILHARAIRRHETLSAQLQHALNSRVVIEQAKGVLAERMGLTMAAAFSALRNYARSNNARVSELALSIVDGDFDTNLLRP
jgi:transcriptional regulator with GAF, ATPase, and Fis domain